jgi:hypothetical protein
VRTIVERIIEHESQTMERQLVPVSPVSKSPRPEAAAPAAAPTINVTIGRIEVRVTATQAPAKQQRGGPEVMSLEEYLRRRSGGGGR